VLFAGTRSTVYVSLDAGTQWQPLTLNLPGVQVRDVAINARQGQVAVATHGRAFWVLDNLALLEALADGTQTLYKPETAWLSHAYGGQDNPKYGATVFFNIPKSYDGKTPVTISFQDANGKTVRAFSLHKREKHPNKIADDILAGMTAADQNAYNLRRKTAIDPGMNVFQWDMRYAPPTEIIGARAMGTDDFSDQMVGPTIVPGDYTVLLDYGGTVSKQPLHVAIDPRFHPAAGELDARLALAQQIAGTLDELNRTVNAALDARSRMDAAKRAQLDAALAKIVEFRFASSEADVIWETQLRDHLAFLMNELDPAYQAPTAAESATYDDLKHQADDAIARLKALMP